VSPKVRHLLYKIRCLLYKYRDNTGICRGCTIPVLSWKCPATAGICLSNYCFFVPRVHFPVKSGYGCLVLVASNVFAIANPDFYVQRKNNAPLWMGNPRCQGAWFLPALRLCQLLTLLLRLWRFLSRRSARASLLQRMFWQLSARQSLQSSIGCWVCVFAHEK